MSGTGATDECCSGTTERELDGGDQKLLQAKEVVLDVRGCYGCGEEVPANEEYE